jgi:hypothetical protein
MINIESMTDEEFKAARARLDALKAELAARTQGASMDGRRNEAMAALVVLTSMVIMGGALWAWFDGWYGALWAWLLGWL